MRLFAGMLVTAALVALVGCERIRPHRFELLNSAGTEVTEVRIGFGDAVLTKDRLEAGEAISFSPTTDTDGGIVLSYELEGRRIEHPLGYAAPPVAAVCDIRIVGRAVEGECR